MNFGECELILPGQAVVQHFADGLSSDFHQIHVFEAGGLERIFQPGGQIQIVDQPLHFFAFPADDSRLLPCLLGKKKVVLKFAGVPERHGERRADVMGDPANPLGPCVILSGHIGGCPVQSCVDFRQLALFIQMQRPAVAQILDSLQCRGHGLFYPAGIPEQEKGDQEEVEQEDCGASSQQESHIRPVQDIIIFYQSPGREACHHQAPVLPRPDLYRVILQIPAAEGGDVPACVGTGQLLRQILLPDHSSILVQQHGPGTAFLHQGESGIVGCPDPIL